MHFNYDKKIHFNILVSYSYMHWMNTLSNTPTQSQNRQTPINEKNMDKGKRISLEKKYSALRNSLISTHCESHRVKQAITWERLSRYCVTLWQFTTKLKKTCTNNYTEQENVKIVSQFYNNFIQKNGVGWKQDLQNRLKTNKQWVSVILMKAVQWWEIF